jgi:hypothetical protein
MRESDGNGHKPDDENSGLDQAAAVQGMGQLGGREWVTASEIRTAAAIVLTPRAGR